MRTPRRARATLLGLTFAVLTGAATSAHAQSSILESEPSEDEPTEHPYRSPRQFAFELKFGPYRPDVDSEFERNGTEVRTPYKDFFGDSRRLLTQIEFDWQLFKRFGSLAAGVGVGYFSVTGVAPQGNGTGLLSGDTSGFKVVPFNLSLIYRFDYFLEQRGIPFVPFGKIGLDWAYWQITDGNGDIATDPMGNSGRGGTLGWHASAGLALILDFLDPEAARDFDADLGVNHTGLSFEFEHADISGLGRSGRLHLGDTTWSLGVLFEF